MAFIRVVSTTSTEQECWCGATKMVYQYSDGKTRTRCEANDAHSGEVCAAVGHPDAWNTTTACTICNAPVQWVRVEVSEGRAYTYVSYVAPALEKGEWVRLPGNVVQTEDFAGRVIRVLKAPEGGYAGPYKAVLGRLL